MYNERPRHSGRTWRELDCLLLDAPGRPSSWLPPKTRHSCTVRRPFFNTPCPLSSHRRTPINQSSDTYLRFIYSYSSQHINEKARQAHTLVVLSHVHYIVQYLHSALEKSSMAERALVSSQIFIALANSLGGLWSV